jgi:hypothetical protein
MFYLNIVSWSKNSPTDQNCLIEVKLSGLNSTGADGGPRSGVSARLTLRSAPHGHQQKVSGTHARGGGGGGVIC